MDPPSFGSLTLRLARRDLKLHGRVYKLETGEVFAFDPGRGQFVSLLDVGRGTFPAFRRRRIAEI